MCVNVGPRVSAYLVFSGSSDFCHGDFNGSRVLVALHINLCSTLVRHHEPDTRCTLRWMPTERKLRSKDDARANPALFNFDSINKLLHRDQEIKVVRFGAAPLYCDTEIETRLNPKEVDLTISAALQPRRLSQDPLDDALYNAFHRRMRKEERRMTNIDRTRILNEVDTLQSLLAQLQQHDWNKYLQSITLVHNPYSISEMEYKKALTIYEIRRLLDRYDHWRKREEQLAADIRQYNHGEDAHLDRMCELSMPLNQLKRLRKSQRCQRHGPVVKLKLCNGSTLLIDPIQPPKFIRSETTAPGNSSAPPHPHKIQIEVPALIYRPFSILRQWQKARTKLHQT